MWFFDYAMQAVFAFAGIMFTLLGLFIWAEGNISSRFLRGVTAVFVIVIGCHLAGYLASLWWYAVIEGFGGIVVLDKPFRPRFVATAVLIVYAQALVGIGVWEFSRRRHHTE